LRLCTFVQKGFPCKFGDSCRQTHDLKKYLELKAKDIDTTCYVFRAFGKCQFGPACRFSTDHCKYETDESGNVTFKIIDGGEEKPRLIYNVLDKDLQNKLWKRKYDFKRTSQILSTVNKYCDLNKALKYNKNKGLVERQENQG